MSKTVKVKAKAKPKTRTIHISTDPTGCGHRFWFILYIYPTVKDLQSAAIAYSNESPEFWSGAAGCFQPRFTVDVDRKGKPVRTRKTSFIGVMRLCDPYLNYGVIIHESLHAAINLVRAMTLERYFDLEKIDNEEALAHSVQEISCAIFETLANRNPRRGKRNVDSSKVSKVHRKRAAR